MFAQVVSAVAEKSDQSSPWEQATLLVPTPIWVEMVWGVLVIVAIFFAVSRFFVPVKGKLEQADVPVDLWCIFGGFLIALGGFSLGLGYSLWCLLAVLGGVAMLAAHGVDYWPEDLHHPPPRDPSVTNLYKDAAHTFVGILIAASIIWPWIWGVTVFLTVVEVVAFIARRKKPCPPPPQEATPTP